MSQIIARIQVSQWTRVVHYADGTLVIWQGEKRYENPTTDKLADIEWNLAPGFRARFQHALKREVDNVPIH